jgi:hypothetical protein
MSRTQKYFDAFVVRNFRAFSASEQRIVDAVRVGDAAAIEEARIAALVAGMNAAVPAYHLADTAIIDRPPWVPSTIGTGKGEAKKLAEFLEQKHCFMLRSQDAELDNRSAGSLKQGHRGNWVRLGRNALWRR